MRIARVVALAVAFVCVCVIPAQAEKVTIQGNLVTSFCYLANDSMGADHKECAMRCTNEGAPAGIVTAEGEYVPISAYVLKIADHMEDEVRVTGEMKEGMLILSKFEVRDGSSWKEIDAGPTGGS